MICCHFFCSAVFSMPVCRKPIVGSSRDDRLAVELEHQPQHAVRAGVLRPHVDGHRLGANLRHRSRELAARRQSWPSRPALRVASTRSRCARMFAANSSAVSCSGDHDSRVLADLHRIVLAQRMPFPVVGHQNAPQIRMAVERDAEQIEHLALGPVRPPDRHGTTLGNARIVAGHTHLHAQPPRRRRRARSAYASPRHAR